MTRHLLHDALCALRHEVLDFHFGYPLEAVADAGPKDSLHYYLYSEKLKWTVMYLDAFGIPRAHRRTVGEYYKPALSAWWGLLKLGHYLRHQDERSLNDFFTQLDWLECNAVLNADGSVVWPNLYNSREGSIVQRSPWVSAYDQGLAISAVVRGYRLTGRTKLLELLQGASGVFEKPAAEGGVRIPWAQGALYAELPAGSAPGILDGFMTSLLGLYDLFAETDDARVFKLFRDGIDGLKHALPQWDYRGRWSWYASHAYLSPPSYHQIHRLQLQVLARLAQEPSLAAFADRWDPARLSNLARAEIYLGFVITKNRNRVRHRTWRQHGEA
jgi:heparosan-N-sulfate-glucuronate 5-epimerase